jgi:predicted metal-dependent hydrolase
MYQQMYLHQLNSWRLKRDGDDLRRWRLQWERILATPGQRRYLEDFGRPLLELDVGLSEFVDEIYQELESQAA